MANFDGAFNDIGLVDVYIYTRLGTLKAERLGPADVAISAVPGNGGNIMDTVEGSTGQLLANKSYKVKNWGLSVSFLRHSLDYCRGTFLIQEMLDGNIPVVGIKVINRNFGDGSTTYGKTGASAEALLADCAFLVNFPGFEAGAGSSGDFTLSFKLSNADYYSGTYKNFSEEYDRDHRIPGMNKTNTGVYPTDRTGNAEPEVNAEEQ